MRSSERLRRRILAAELRCSRCLSFLKGIPLLRHLHRSVTAGVEMLDPKEHIAIGFRIKFLSPYFHLPVAVEKTQIGYNENNGRFTPTAFRFFDWHSWNHIEGMMAWEGAHTVVVKSASVEVITGFVYSISELAVAAENYGLRLAEGADDTIRIADDNAIQRVSFEPGYWMLEPQGSKYDVVAIHDNDLMVLIVSLSSVGSGKQRVYEKSIQQLEDWIAFNLRSKNPERLALELLRYVRDWGPLRMQPLFPGLVDVLQRLHIPNQEKILFDFYADNFGMSDNRNGRLLAVSMLQALGTDKARAALNTIYDYSKNREIKPAELRRIQNAIQAVSAAQPEGIRVNKTNRPWD